MEGFNVPEAGDAGLDTPDAMYAGRELYRALRGNQGDDPLVDDMLWDGDFLTTQREFIQKQQEEQMLERLERRMGKFTCHQPVEPALQQSAAAAVAFRKHAAARKRC